MTEKLFRYCTRPWAQFDNSVLFADNIGNLPHHYLGQKSGTREYRAGIAKITDGGAAKENSVDHVLSLIHAIAHR